MPVQSQYTLTFLSLEQAIAQNTKLDASKIAAMRSALKRFADIVGKHSSQIIADPQVVRRLKADANWQMAGLNKASWANICSSVSKAMELCGVKVHRSRRNFKPDPEWMALLARLSALDLRDLQRFAGWCTTLGKAPHQVDTAVFGAYLHYLNTQSVQKNPKERWHVARRAWNKLSASQQLGFPYIDNTEPEGWRALRWECCPQTLRDELEIYKKQATKPAGLIFQAQKRVKPVTLHGYLNRLRYYVTYLVEDGVSLNELGSLAVLAHPDMVERGLTMASKGRDLDMPATQMRLQAIMIAVLHVAHYLKGPVEQMAVLNQQFKSVKYTHEGMTPKNRARLAQFDHPASITVLVNLPQKVVDDIEANGSLKVAAARRMQLACAVAILLNIPLRVKNLASLDLDQHIQLPAAGKSGPWRISVIGSQVKNEVPIDALLDEPTSALLQLYCQKYRPLLFAGKVSSCLFLSQTGTKKGEGAVAHQISTFIKRESGLTVNAHLFRHIAGFFYLRANPGHYETVRRLLGHKNIATTITAYTGAETDHSFQNYYGILAKFKKPS